MLCCSLTDGRDGNGVKANYVKLAPELNRDLAACSHFTFSYLFLFTVH